MDFSLKMGFSLFFPCYVWGGRAPTAALADKARDKNRQVFRLGIYQIRQADRPTQNKWFYLVFIFNITTSTYLHLKNLYFNSCKRQRYLPKMSNSRLTTVPGSMAWKFVCSKV